MVFSERVESKDEVQISPSYKKIFKPSADTVKLITCDYHFPYNIRVDLNIDESI